MEERFSFVHLGGCFLLLCWSPALSMKAKLELRLWDGIQSGMHDCGPNRVSKGKSLLGV